MISTKPIGTVVWSECFVPDATSDRGWLKAVCAPYEPHHDPHYTSATMPVWDEEISAWREQSTLGNYLDYSPCRPPSDAPQVHCICYVTGRTKYVYTVQQAREWIEMQVKGARPDLCVEVQGLLLEVAQQPVEK